MQAEPAALNHEGLWVPTRLTVPPELNGDFGSKADRLTGQGQLSRQTFPWKHAGGRSCQPCAPSGSRSVELIDRATCWGGCAWGSMGYSHQHQRQRPVGWCIEGTQVMDYWAKAPLVRGQIPLLWPHYQPLVHDYATPCRSRKCHSPQHFGGSDDESNDAADGSMTRRSTMRANAQLRLAVLGGTVLMVTSIMFRCYTERCLVKRSWALQGCNPTRDSQARRENRPDDARCCHASGVSLSLHVFRSSAGVSVLQ
jgi:hypothetical protein